MGYPHIHCDCPFWCPNAYDCEELANDTAYFYGMMDMNNDGVVDMMDSDDTAETSAHLTYVLDACDADGNH